MAIGSGVALVLLLLAGCAVLVGFFRSKVQRDSQVETVGEAETINNLTNNCHRSDRDLAISVMPMPGVKNINKKMDFCSGEPDEGSSPGRSSYKSRHLPADYNLVHEVNYEQAAKEAMLEAACKDKDSFEFEEKRSKRLKCDASEKKAPEMSACADTKYKSVFVMSEEKDECIIATEV